MIVGLNYELALQEELLSAYQRKWLWYVRVTHGLLDMYTLNPQACGPRGLDMRIR